MTQGLVVIRPLEITPEILVDSNIPETDYPAWSADSTYGDGDRVVVVSRHKVYQSLGPDNKGNDPTANAKPPKWIEVGPTNRWRPFDRSVSSQAAQAGSMTWRFRLDQAVNALALINTRGGTYVSVSMEDPIAGEVYARNLNLSGVPMYAGWWAWFYEKRTPATQVILRDLPSYPKADIVLVLHGSDELAVGAILLGRQREFSIGVRSGVRVGIQDYSRKERNEFGDVVLAERAFAKRCSLSMLLQSHDVDPLQQFLASVRAVPCLWLVSERFESTTIYGFYKSFETALQYFDYADCDLDLEGLT